MQYGMNMSEATVDFFTKLKTICEEQLTHLGTSDKHKERLVQELKEVYAQNESEYFLRLYEEKTRYRNENNLIVPYLLGICDDFDIDKTPNFVYGEYPDIDIDYLPSIRNYLKEEYAREQFGEDYVCNIATYTTFGLRSALIDMAKVFDLDRKEILNLTTRLGIKDDEGEILTWDKAIELYDDLAKYLQQNPDMADAARRILHRNRNMGMHASGLIISGVPIKEFVPLVRIKDGAGACSAWVEGLHGTDLGAVGLVKFDFLSLEGNMKIAQATKLANQLYDDAMGLTGFDSSSDCINIIDAAANMVGKVAALPGKSNWTDTSYLNDPKAIEMADKGDLKMIFQYDGSEGIRRLAKQGGITSFDDLVAYTALYRPGPMKLNYHEVYCTRKRGKEEYTIHPLLEDFMSFTYGVLTYQEQIMKLLNVVGKVPLKDCEAVRKAISKKKVEKFIKYKEMFVTNGQVTLGMTVEELEHIWKQIEAFAGYGFNLSHAVAYTYISSRMLYLKVHYPLAFYTSVLDCTKAAGPKDYAKLKDYKMEAIKHGVKVNRVDINKSRLQVSAQNGEIYWSFNKIKGVGDEPAARMEQMQPYADYEDFLKRFGTDAKANQAVVALRLFDGDPITNYQYYEAYKASEKKRNERQKRYDATMEKHRTALKALIGDQYVEDFTIDDLLAIQETMCDDSKKQLQTIWKRMNASKITYEKKSEADMPSLANFQPDASTCEIDEAYLALLNDRDAAEEAYYGFIWDHPLERCRFYTHKTFEQYDVEGLAIGPVEVMIKAVSQKKGPKATYYSLEVEDAVGESKRITCWSDDYKRFEEVLVKGRCLRITVAAPSNGFSNYTLHSPKERWKKPKKEHDLRVFPID